MSDPDDGDTLVFALSGAGHGNFAVAAAAAGAQLAVAAGASLDHETAPSYTLTVSVSDGRAGDNSPDASVDDTIEVTVAVTDANDAPFAVDDAAATVEDAAVEVAVTANDTDPDGDSLEAAVKTQPANGAAAVKAGSGGAVIVYTPAADFNGTDSFTYTVTDGSLTADAEVTVTVNAANDAPSVSGSASVDYAENASDAVASYTVTDPDAGDSHTWSLEGDDADDFILSTAGALSFNAPPDYETPADSDTDGKYSVTVKATDNGTPPQSGTLAVTVTVTDVDAKLIVVEEVNPTTKEVAFTLSGDTDTEVTLTVTEADASASTGTSVTLPAQVANQLAGSSTKVTMKAHMLTDVQKTTPPGYKFRTGAEAVDISGIELEAGQTATVCLLAGDGDTSIMRYDEASRKWVELAGTRIVARGSDKFVCGETDKFSVFLSVSAPRVMLALSPSVISEDGGVSTVTATVNNPRSSAVTVTVAAAPVPPAKAGDFTLSANRVLTIAANETRSTGTVTIAAVDNPDQAPTRRLAVTVTGTVDDPAVRVLAPVTLAIIDDETPRPRPRPRGPVETYELPVVDTPFSDLGEAHGGHRDNIARIYGLGITVGTSPTTYSPNAAATRAQMASFLARMFRVLNGWDAPVVDTPFSDLGEAHGGHRDNIARIYGLGITVGTSPTTYSPNAAATRAQMASFLARMFRVLTGPDAPVADQTG